MRRTKPHATLNGFGLPYIITEGCPPDTIIMAHRDVIAAAELAYAAERMAAHGILPESTAAEIRSDVDRFIEREARAKRIGVITNIGR